MGFLGFGKKGDFVDLTERFKKQQEKISQTNSENSSTVSQTNDAGNAFSFLGDLASSVKSSPQNTQDNYVDVSGAEDKRKKLAKRFMDLTTKIEELSNQIYHLQQRVEVLERKGGIDGF
jgi:chromosome segregation ATPase